MHNEISDVVFYVGICMYVYDYADKPAQRIQMTKIWIIITKHSAILNKMETTTREAARDENKSSCSE